jgi:autotransporter-associated beta strand protein
VTAPNMNVSSPTWPALARPVLPARRTVLGTCLRTLCPLGILGLMHSASASTTITSGNTFTIDNFNTTVVGTVTTWNDTGTLTIHGGGTLQTWPDQNESVVNNDAIVFAGTGGTITLRFNGNDTDHKLNGSSITSTATGAQTLDVRTGYVGNGDRESVTFYKGIPNVGDGSPLGLNVTFRSQTSSTGWVNLPAVNTFTGPITLVQGSGPPVGTLTIGGQLTRYNGNTNGSGTLGGGNYPGAIALGTGTILNYASSAPQILSGGISGLGSLTVGGGGTLTLSGASTFSGNTTVSSGSALVLASTGEYKFYVTDATANKITGGGSATLNGSFTVDTSAVTVTSGSWTLVDTSTKSFGGSFGLNGFTGPVGNVYTKSAAGQVWTFNKSTGVLSLSSKAIITAFGLPGNAGTINQAAKTIALTVPYGTTLATLAPTFTVTSGTVTANGNAVSSGSPPSPTFASTNPATYTVTDGAVVNNYSVTVSVTPASSAKDILSCNFGALGAATITGTSIVLTVPPGQAVTSLAPTFTLSQFATLSPLSGSTQNFTNPVNYTVTAQNGTTKVYAVSVQTYAAWAHSGSLFIITTPDGANIPGGVTETNFPLLVRLDSGNFNFGEAQSDGRDIRFTTAGGAALPYQIEEWDAGAGTASIWIKIPTITGNARQEIVMYWGKTGVASESDGSAIFNAANGYASVIHMDGAIQDEVGSVTPTNSGTTLSTGRIGRSRHLSPGQGINCGTNITSFPTGSGSHSSQAWIRPDAANNTVLGWGIEQGQGKVVMQLANPPHMNMDCYFGGGNVTGGSTLALGEWIHVVHTYQSNSARIYVNGVLDGSTGGGTMNIPSPARMYIGGWYGNYNFSGDIDEVRISKVTRSANWVKLEYENQKSLQTLVGSLVQSGTTFSASPPSVTINEGTGATLTGQAGGAQKVYWIQIKDGQETVLAVDQFSLDITAGRVTGDENYTIQFRGIYPTQVQTVDIPVTITEDLPDPVFTLTAPATWDGRQTVAITADISNLATLQSKGVANFSYDWTVDGVAVIKEITPGTLTLLRSQGGGPMTVTLTMNNGGEPVSQSVVINVQEPASDAWVQRTPGANEKPVNMQFYARDPNTNNGTIYYNGTQGGSPDEVYLKVYTTDGGDVLYATHRQALTGTAYAFSAPIAAGKVTYKVVYGTRTGGVDSAPLATVSNLVCGDAYIIEGQSNALATDNAEPNNSATDPWIRTYGLTQGWGGAIIKGSEMQLGLWGWYLANQLSDDYNMPICIINAAVGGTRIDQHMPNPAGHGTAGSLYSIYANLYNRVVGGKLTHGIRGVMWHQGEQDQGSGGPDGDYDYKFHQQYFVDMSAAWKQDFPNLRNYYIFQIWPAACGDTSRNDQLREVQRTLPFLYSNMKIMSTVGIIPGSGCHYVAAGYQRFADLIGPLVEEDVYGYVPAGAITAPNLVQAWFTTPTRNAIALQFDQNMASWDSGSNGLFFLDGAAGQVSSGSVSGKVVTLQLSAPSAAGTITYLKGIGWNGVQADLVYGANSIAALTFADVPIAALPPSSYSSWAAEPGQGLTAGVNDGPLDDPNFNGIVNLLEFVLGGHPLQTSSATLPAVTQSGGGTWSFEYERSNLSAPPATTQVVEYGSDFTGWTPVTIPATSAGSVTITPGTPSDHVSVALPDLGPKGFARLKVTE